MRIVNFSHDSMTRVMTDFPVVNFAYSSSNIPESPAYGVFVSQFICYARVCSKCDFLFWFQSYWSRDILHGNFSLLLGNSVVVIQTLFTNLTHQIKSNLCNICWMVGSVTVTYDWCPFIWGKSWRVLHVRQEMFTLSGTPDFTPFGEFMISPIHCIHITPYITEFVSFRTMFTA